MDSPRPTVPDPHHIAGLVALEADLDQVSRELRRVRDRVASTRREWAAGPNPATAPATTTAAYLAPAPVATPRPVPTSPPPPVRPASPPPWWQREGAVARVLSAVGAGVLLIGVSLLLVLAIQSGYFGPVPRVAAGTVVALGLLLIGIVVHRRQPGNAGAVALAACGVAGGYLDVVAASTIYGWVPAAPGLLLAAVVFAVGLVLSRRWGSQVLAVIVVLGVVLLAPVVGGERLWLPSAFLVLVCAGSQLVDVDRDWPVLQVSRVLPASLVLASGPLFYGGDPDATALLIDAGLVTGFAALILAGQLWTRRRGHRGGAVSTTMLGVSGVPALAVVWWSTEGGVATVWLLALAAGWVAASWLLREVADRAVLLVLGALAVLGALTGLEREDLLVPGLLVVAVGYLALGVRHRAAGWVGIGVGALGLALYLPIMEPLLDGPRDGWFGLGEVFAGVLAVGVAVLTHLFTTRWSPNAGRSPRVVWLLGSWAAGLLGVTGAAVTTGVLLGRSTGDPGTGFVAGHATATLVWLAAGVWLLTRSLSAPSRRHSSVGMAVAGLAVAKLLLFDLSTLDGVVRVLAFLVAGGALLALGTLYARSRRDTRPVAG